MTKPDGTNEGADSTATGPGASVGERITGEHDPRDPDGLITLDDLPDRLGPVSDLGDLARKAGQYGDQQDGAAGTTQEN